MKQKPSDPSKLFDMLNQGNNSKIPVVNDASINEFRKVLNEENI